MTSNFELPGTIIRVLDPQFQNGAHFWNPLGLLYQEQSKNEFSKSVRPPLMIKYRINLRQTIGAWLLTSVGTLNLSENSVSD